MDDSVFLTLLGKTENSPEMAKFLSFLDISPTIEEFEDERSYYSFPRFGFAIVLDEKVIEAIQFFAEGAEKNLNQYCGKLPKELAFSDTRDEVVKKLGLPTKSREGIDDPRPFVRLYPWFKYFLNGYNLYVQFDMANTSIRMVGLERKQ